MTLPPIDKMWPELPVGDKSIVADLVGGPIAKNIRDNDWDTCCIRVCRALNYAGAAIADFAGIPNPYMDPGTKVRALKGGDSKWYIYSTYDMRVYLTFKYGKPKKFKGDAGTDTVSGEAGVIMFGFLHVDLWNGTEVRNHGYFGDPRVKGEGVLIWPAPKTSPPAPTTPATQ